MTRNKFPIFAANQAKHYRRPYIPVMVEAVKLDELWQLRCEPDGDYFQAGTRNQFNGYWFDRRRGEEHYSFFCGRCYVSVNKKTDGKGVFFNDGRHRTRWLIDLGIRYVPVAISPSSLNDARDLGLECRELQEGESIALPVTEQMIFGDQERKMEER